MCSSRSGICPTDLELETLLEGIRKRFAELDDDRCQRSVFLNHLKSLTIFGQEPNDYESPDAAELPRELEIAFAVCHPACGNQAFVVVEGGPQSCDCCGGTMLPVETRIYRKKKQEGNGAA